MIIYHKTNGIIISTCVIIGAGNSDISHGSHIWDKHKENVDKLENNGDVFVTGASHYGAVYSGEFVPREIYSRYINN